MSTYKSSIEHGMKNCGLQKESKFWPTQFKAKLQGNKGLPRPAGFHQQKANLTNRNVSSGAKRFEKGEVRF